MRPLIRWALFLAVPLLLLGVSASAASAPASNAKPTKPKTLVTEKGPIRAFAQDAEAIAWIGLSYKVHVRSLLLGASAVVGSAAPVAGTPKPALALAGTRALWTQFAGGTSMEYGLWTSTFGARPMLIDLFMGGNGDPGGIFLGGVAGDGPTLLYGKTAERCDNPGGVDCKRLDVTGGGVIFVTGQFEQSSVSTIPAPVMLAFAGHDPQSGQISQGMVAVAPAESPLLSDLGDAPRVAENGSVQVYRFLNKPVLVSSVAPRGTIKAIALSFPQLAVLVQRTDGTKAVIRYAAKGGALLGTTVVPKATASELSVSKAGIVYRVGKNIYLLGSGQPKLVWKASGTPIGLSIEGRRIAWAENVKGHGRIVALTAPSSVQVSARSSDAAAPKRNGDILFVSGHKDDLALYSVRPDGTHQRRIGAARNVWSPAWSPGGKWIAYGATPRKGGLCPQLYLVRADGTHTRRLTHDRNCYLNPTWAPGGTRIAFEVWGGPRTPGIWTMNVNGSGLRLLTTTGDNPAWSPDGRTIAFRSKFPEAIWLMNADGSNLRQLTLPPRPTVMDMQPDWSPNGKSIAFSREGGAGIDIYVIGSDGSGLRQLVSIRGRSNTMPTWSPDGTRIAFVSDRAHRGLGDIYVMKANGSGQKRLTRTLAEWPDWRAR